MFATPFAIPLVLTSILLVLIITRLSLAKSWFPITAYRIMLIFCLGWVLDYSIIISTNNIDAAGILWDISFVMQLGVATTTLVMVLQIIGARKWLSGWRMALILFIPSPLVFLNLTNHLHHLFRSYNNLSSRRGFAEVDMATTPPAISFYAFQIIFIVLSMTLLLVWAVRNRKERTNATLFSIASGLSLLQTPVSLCLPDVEMVPYLMLISALLNLFVQYKGTFFGKTYMARERIMDEGSTIAITVDGHGATIDLNARARSLFGVARNKVHGFTIPTEWSEALKIRDPWPSEISSYYVTVNDHEYRVESIGLSDTDGRKFGLSCMVFDETERRAAERALAESEEKFHGLADTANVGLYICDDKKMHFANAAFFSMTGYSEADFEWLEPLRIVHPAFRERSREMLLSRLSGKRKSDRYEGKVLCKNGSELWVVVSAAFITYGGKPAAIGSFIDISEQKKLEISLRESKHLYESIVEGSNDPIFRWRIDGTLTFANSAYCSIFSVSREKIIGKTDFSWVEASMREYLYDICDEILMHDGHIPNGKETFEICELSSRCFTWSFSSYRDESGKTVEIQAIGRDITARKKAEESMQESNESLSQQLELNAQLREQLEELAIRDGLTGLYNRRYLDESLERELAAVSREKTPLAVIMLDIDFFKHLNDQFGHPAGDEVLRLLGQTLSAHTRAMDIACRYGGEEFVVILPRMNARDAFKRAEEMRASIAGLRVRPENISFTASFGVSAFPYHGMTGAALLETADAALYRSKEAGRNKVTLF